MTARFLVGDTRDRLGDIPDHTVDLILTSPPFLALRSYLPDDHPNKAKEIGSEPNPTAFIDVLLELTAEWGRVLAPHGSIAVELGDTYAGSGGAGGDYGEDGLREGQPKFRQGTPRWDGRPTGQVRTTTSDPVSYPPRASDGWPLAKSLACIPQLYQVALAYGINPLTGQPSPAGKWRVRTLKPWIRSNPPVGALGDKERPATSYVIVACRASDRWFDLDAVRTRPTQDPATYTGNGYTKGRPEGIDGKESMPGNAGGAPPRDWWHHVDAVLDACMDELGNRAPRPGGPTGGKAVADSAPRDHGNVVNSTGWVTGQDRAVRGVHLRRALERAGILTTLEALDVSPKGYSGAHYAVWPPELVRLLVDEMCPRRVCVVCGQPSRRIVDARRISEADDTTRRKSHAGAHPGGFADVPEVGWEYSRTTLGWSDCGHNTWRPGHVLDPFAGSGTTLAVTQGMGRQATGIDIDERNAWLARERVGMFLEVDEISREDPATGSLTTGVNQ